MRGRVLAFAILAIAVALAASLPPAQAQAVVGVIRGPEALGTGRAAMYNITVAGGPVGPSLRYTITFYLTGPNVAGGSPLEASPGTVTGNQTLFQVNVTAPASEGAISLVAKINATDGVTTETTTAQFAIQVLAPLLLSGTFRNNGAAAAVNVTVRFYVNGVLVGTDVMGRVGASGEATASYSWLPVGLGVGRHTLRVEADLDGDGAIDPGTGEVATSEFFYREAPPLPLIWTVGISVGIAVAALFGTVAFRRRKKR